MDSHKEYLQIPNLPSVKPTRNIKQSSTITVKTASEILQREWALKQIIKQQKEEIKSLKFSLKQQIIYSDELRGELDSVKRKGFVPVYVEYVKPKKNIFQKFLNLFF